MAGSRGRVIVSLVALLAVLAAAGYGVAQAFLGGPSADELAARQAGRTLALNGREGVAACAGCHGQNGEGNFAAGFPRLAGLHRDYIVKQLQDFGREPPRMGVHVEPIARDYNKTPRIYKDLTIYSPGIRQDPVMTPVARALTDEEIEQLAAYYSALPFEHNPVPADFDTLERGLELAVRGKPEYLMPRCDACHAPKGQGFGPHFPPLAGQPPQYIIKQINAWQSGTRDNDHLAMMKNTANLLTDGDKINVARYYANQSYRVNME